MKKRTKLELFFLFSFSQVKQRESEMVALQEERLKREELERKLQEEALLREQLVQQQVQLREKQIQQVRFSFMNIFYSAFSKGFIKTDNMIVYLKF